MTSRLLQVTVFLILVANILSTTYILFETEQSIRATTADASHGTAYICINGEPTLTLNCSPVMTQDVPYVCQLLVSDPNNQSVEYFQFPQPPDIVELFAISDDGLISFTPTNDDVGNHSILIGIDDGSGCDNAYDYALFDFEVNNVNDPPFLFASILNQSFDEGEVLYAFAMGDHFLDPDDDPLNYTFVFLDATTAFNITIEESGQVILGADGCGIATVVFTATDPYNLSATSNEVIIEAVCEDDQGEDEDEDEDEGESSGGGGGAGRCRPELICLPWSECYPNGLQVQVCKDKNGCDDKEIKRQQECTYVEERPLCEENWLCEEWSVCSMNGWQTRQCVDLAECGSTTYRPPTEQRCLYQPTCSDGVQNGDETGIDCGGGCAPCQEIQSPSLLPSLEGFRHLWLLLLLLLLGVLLALGTLYRDRIYEALVELGWMMARRREKELLLAPGERRILFEELRHLDSRLADLPPQQAYEFLAVAMRKYFSFVCRLPFEYLPEDLDRSLGALRVSPQLGGILRGLAGRLRLLESGRLSPERLNPLLFSSVEEEFRLLICLTSAYERSEIERPLPERPITEELSFVEEIRFRLLNVYEALQFSSLEIAKEEYGRIMRAYENLPVKQKELLFPDIGRLYLEIGYVAETS